MGKMLDKTSYNNPDVSIIICEQNDFYSTKKCVASITKLKSKISYEIIITNNHSADVNNTISHAKGPYILLMNNGMIAKPKFIDLLFNTISQNKEIGVVGAMLLKEEGTIQEVGSTIFADGTTERNCYQWKKIDKSKTYEVDYFSDYGIIFSKEDWCSIGGFDEVYKTTNYKNADLCFKIKYNLGKKVICQPKSQLYYLENNTCKDDTEMNEFISNSKSVFQKKWSERLYKSSNLQKENYIDTKSFSVYYEGVNKVVTISGIKFVTRSKKLMKQQGIHYRSLFVKIICKLFHYFYKIITVFGKQIKIISEKLSIKRNNLKNSFEENIFSIRASTTTIAKRKTINFLGLRIEYKYTPLIKFIKHKNPLVSIIIPVFNQYDYTVACLESVCKNIGDISYEIIIADDCSTDKTKHIKKKIKNIVVSRNESNLGYIKNCNKAAKLAKGKYLYFLNNDTVVQPNWLKELLNVIEIHNDIGVVGSKILNANGTLQECGIYMFSDSFNNMIRGSNISTGKYDCLCQCDYVSGCSLLTPKTLFDEIGGFDEMYSPAYCDDPDYCLNALSKGFKTYVQPKSIIIHFGSISYNANSNHLKEKNIKLLKEKWQAYFKLRSNYDSRKDCSGITRKAYILVVDDFFPQFDKHAGGKSTFQIIELLKRMDLNIKFCALFAEENEEPYYSILTDMGIEVIRKDIIHSWIEDNIGYLDYIFLSRPQVAVNFMIENIKERGVRILYYGQDLHHVRMLRGSSICNIFDSTEIEKMKISEQSIISFCDMAFFPSVMEKQYINNVFHLHNVEVITPFLYDSNKMIKHASFENSKDIIFVGSSHGPNLDGLLWFLDNIFPIIVREIPDICLNVVGSSVADEIRAIDSPNIKVIGYLSEDELSSFYSKTRLTIAPLRYGAGIKGKIIDSLYHSTPVVTTSIGIEGINNPYGLIKCSDDENGFAQYIIDLYTKPEEWESLVPLYSRFIQENYSFDVAEIIFRRFIDTTDKENAERIN